jgi:hypothetical protein
MERRGNKQTNKQTKEVSEAEGNEQRRGETKTKDRMEESKKGTQKRARQV